MEQQEILQGMYIGRSVKFLECSSYCKIRSNCASGKEVTRELFVTEAEGDNFWVKLTELGERAWGQGLSLECYNADSPLSPLPYEHYRLNGKEKERCVYKWHIFTST